VNREYNKKVTKGDQLSKTHLVIASSGTKRKKRQGHFVSIGVWESIRGREDGRSLLGDKKFSIKKLSTEKYREAGLGVKGGIEGGPSKDGKGSSFPKKKTKGG